MYTNTDKMSQFEIYNGADEALALKEEPKTGNPLTQLKAKVDSLSKQNQAILAAVIVVIVLVVLYFLNNKYNAGNGNANAGNANAGNANAGNANAGNGNANAGNGNAGNAEGFTSFLPQFSGPGRRPSSLVWKK